MGTRIFISPKPDEGLYFHKEMGVSAVVSMEASAGLDLQSGSGTVIHDIVENTNSHRRSYSYRDTPGLIARALSQPLGTYGSSEPIEILPYINLDSCQQSTGPTNVLAPNAELVRNLARKHFAPTLFEKCRNAGYFIPRISLEDAQGLIERGQPIVATSDISSGGSGVFRCSQPLEFARMLMAMNNQEPQFAPFLTASSWNMHVIVGHDTTTLVPPSRQLIQAQHTSNGEALLYEGNVYVPTMHITDGVSESLRRIALTAAEDLRTLGYRGTCGLDILVENSTGLAYIVDINPRLQASTFAACVLQRAIDLRPMVVDHCEAVSSSTFSYLPRIKETQHVQNHVGSLYLWNIIIRSDANRCRIVSKLPMRRSTIDDLEPISLLLATPEEVGTFALRKALFLGFPDVATRIEPNSVIARMILWSTDFIADGNQFALVRRIIRDKVVEEFTIAA